MDLYQELDNTRLNWYKAQLKRINIPELDVTVWSPVERYKIETKGLPLAGTKCDTCKNNTAEYVIHQMRECGGKLNISWGDNACHAEYEHTELLCRGCYACEAVQVEVESRNAKVHNELPTDILQMPGVMLSLWEKENRDYYETIQERIKEQKKIEQRKERKEKERREAEIANLERRLAELRK